MSTKAFFPCGGGSNLILGTGTEKQIFILISPAAINLFSSNSQKLSLWCKKNHSSPIWICMTHIWSPTLFPRGIMTFQGVLTKFNFLTKFPYLKKKCRFYEIPKI